MSVINSPRIKDPITVAIREQREHRAIWMYYLTDEARKKGLESSDYAPDAIKRCGLYQGALLKEKGKKGDSLKGLKRSLFSIFAQVIFEMRIKQCDDNHLYIDFHYCPLVKGWQKIGCTDEEIRKLCDHAMCGDKGIANSFGCELDLPKTIARGDDICQIRFYRPNAEGKRGDNK